ncbi:MAG: sugar phosphate nucleotidyltransferase [Verrucomicrobia bacterium]|nr:sugar phosphate nucleotidyltransferase [Verrucomicrobiota bacterium]
MKAIIPAAGLGTRFLPIAKAVPKEMLPLGDKPVIHHVVAEAAAAGFDEILIIVSRGKECIIEYFAPNPELESHLDAAGKSDALAAVRQATSMARIEYAYQEKMLGLGDAVKIGRKFIGADPVFAVLLGDTVMQHSSPLGAMAAAWKTFHKPTVCLEPCAEERVSRYGVAGGRETEASIFELDELVEKPAPDRAPRLTSSAGSRLPFHAFAARYLFTPEIFDCLEKTTSGFAGEIQLTDAMEQLRRKTGMLGITWPGKRLDIGSPAGLIEAARALGS